MQSWTKLHRFTTRVGMFRAKATAGHLINPPPRRQRASFLQRRLSCFSISFLRVTAYFQVLWLAVRERCYSCVWVFVFAALSPTKIVWNSEKHGTQESAMIAKHCSSSTCRYRSISLPISPLFSSLLRRTVLFLLDVKRKGKSVPFMLETFPYRAAKYSCENSWRPS